MGFQTRVGALAALEAAVQAALQAAGADFERDPEKPSEANHNGVVIMRDGDSGTPEPILSPMSFAWEHHVEFEICATGPTRSAKVEALIAALDGALKPDRTLGGTVDDARVVLAPEIKEFEIDGAETERSALVHVQLSYVTASGAG